MELLIVDDEVLAARSIEKGIKWEQLGISRVYVAFSMHEAQEILEKNGRIAIMVCDIEMPNGSGLDLLKWVNGNYPHIVNIFLTCHADFRYAQEAISLGSFEYLLKPVPFDELTKVIDKACVKVRDWEKVQEYSRYGESWKANENRVLEQLWHDVISGKLKGDRHFIERSAEARKLSIDMAGSYALIRIRVEDYGAVMNEWEQGLREFAIKNIMTELVLSEERAPIIVTLSATTFVALVTDADYVGKTDEYKARCETFTRTCEVEFKTTIFCFLSKYSPIEDLNGMSDILEAIDQNYVLFTSRVMSMSDIDKEIYDYRRPNMTVWVVMLEQGEKERFCEEATAYLDALVDKKAINADILNLFYHDFLQLLYAYLSKEGIEANLLFKQYRFKSTYREATQSVRVMKSWIRELVDKTFEHIHLVQESTPVVEKIKKYIDDNIENELSREELANLVFMNPNYLTRLFKKETGFSLSDYIIETRINLAKELLKHLDLSISEVAVKVGYTNFSYFSRIFKKITDMTPQAFRSGQL